MLSGCYLLLTTTYQDERERLHAWQVLQPQETGAADTFLCEATLTAFDAQKGELTLRLDLGYLGPELQGDDGFSLAQDAWLVTNTVKGDNPRYFKAGTAIASQEIVLPAEGVYTDYPFDRHVVELLMQLGVRGPDGVEASLPVALKTSSALMGLDARARLAHAGDNDDLRVEIVLERSTTVRVFSLFLNTAMLVLALVIVAITGVCAFTGRKVELGMLTFFAGMLFAFPAVRGLQPAAPPLGSLTDYYATFWAQGSAALGLFVCGTLWVLRDRER